MTDAPKSAAEALEWAKAVIEMDAEGDNISLAAKIVLRALASRASDDVERDAAREIRKLRAALGLIWTIHVRKNVHLGVERYSGFEQDCIACIAALALGQTMDESPTAEQFEERRAQIKVGDAAMQAEEKNRG